MTPHRRARRRLRLALLALLVVLLVPAIFLVREAWRQVRWEGLHQQQRLARELVAGINRSLEAIRRDEAALAFVAYRFAVATGAEDRVVQRSPLARLPAPGEGLPGLIGRFQLAADGLFSTPLLPTGDPGAYGLEPADVEERAALEARIYAALQAPPPGREPLPPGPAGTAPTPERERPTGEALRAAPEAVGADAEEEAGADEATADGAAGARPGADRASRRSQALFDRLERSAAAPASTGEPLASRWRGRAPAGASGAGDPAPGGKAAMRAAPVPTDGTGGRPARGAGGEAGETAAGPADGRDDAPAGPGSPGSRAGEAPTPRGTAALAPLTDSRLLALDAELDPLSFLLLDSASFVLFRREFHDGRRVLQGAVLARRPFLERLIAAPFRESLVSAAADLRISWGDRALQTVPGRPPPRGPGRTTAGGPRDGALLYEARLVDPFGGLRLRFLARAIPPGPGGAVVLWSGGAFLAVMLVGFQLLHRAGLRQLDLARQQEDFVSAVSHELRTPLTSIRMYSEMLRSGWADEERRREYYDFIHAESERLSRLVANVLHLSRMSRTGLAPALEEAPLGPLLEEIRPGLEQVLAAGGFTLELDLTAEAAGASVRVDRDALRQVLLNLVDNAVKFAAGAADRRVRLAAHCAGERAVSISVRDFGPGLPPGDPDRLFTLFHRPAGTRGEGTGIGLALVRRLVEGMGGSVSADRAAPGAVFRVRLARSD